MLDQMRTRSILRSATGLAVAISAVAACSPAPEPTSNLSAAELAEFCGPATDWFEIQSTRRNEGVDIFRAGGLDSHQDEAAALAVLDPLIQESWRDRNDDDMRMEFEQVVDLNERRLAVVEEYGEFTPEATSRILNFARVEATFNNFVSGSCLADE
jgi:hypothetical protein